jgi:transposase-like protein
MYPRPGKHYPRSVGEFQAWFRTDANCSGHLEWLRWPAGFVCPACAHNGGWRLGDARFKCAGCGGRTSVTAGTIFDRTRTPLTVWFNVCWLFASGKDGISALSLKRTLEIGSYQTAPGGRAKGKKVLTGIAVEIKEPRGYGRCRMAPLADASSASLHRFVLEHVEPGATVITDGWQGYRGLDKLGYRHELRSQLAARARGEDPGKLLPAVHRVASLAKRWLLGTHQGSVANAHLPSYLNEFVFRFNRRRSWSRGMVFYRVLELAAGHAPVRYGDIIAGRRPRKVPPTPPIVRGKPPSMDRPPANRPWRDKSG